MHQEQLFFDRVEDALGAVIDACGGRKRVAVQMYPDKPVQDAHNLLNAQLNPERRERFTPDQVLYLARRGREVGCHAVMQYLAREVGYADPVPVEPEDQEAQLQRQFVDAVGQLQAIQQQLARVQALPRRVA